MLEESMAEGLFDEEYEEDVKSSPMPDAFWIDKLVFIPTSYFLCLEFWYRSRSWISSYSRIFQNRLRDRVGNVALVSRVLSLFSQETNPLWQRQPLNF